MKRYLASVTSIGLFGEERAFLSAGKSPTIRPEEATWFYTEQDAWHWAQLNSDNAASLKIVEVSFKIL